MSDDSRGKTDDGKLLYCSFCGKSQHEVRKLIAGPSVFICDECVELCNDIIREELDEKAERGRDKLPKPHEINAVLDEYVIGQKTAKKVLAGLIALVSNVCKAEHPTSLKVNSKDIVYQSLPLDSARCCSTVSIRPYSTAVSPSMKLSRSLSAATFSTG